MAQIVKNLPAMQKTHVQSLSWEDPLEKEMAIQYSCLENSMDRGAWYATVHGVSKNQTRLSDFTFTYSSTPQRWESIFIDILGEKKKNVPGVFSLAWCGSSVCLWINHNGQDEGSWSVSNWAGRDHAPSSRLWWGKMFSPRVQIACPIFHNWPCSHYLCSTILLCLLDTPRLTEVHERI